MQRSDIAGWPVTLNSGVWGMKVSGFFNSSRASPVTRMNQPASRRPTACSTAASMGVGLSAPCGSGG